MIIASSKKQDSNEKYFVLRTDGSFAEFFSLDEALSSQDNRLVIIDKFKEYYVPDIINGYSWRLSEFVFMDNVSKKEVEIGSNSWKLHSINILYSSSSRISFELVISDPSGEIERKTLEIVEYRNHADRNLNYTEVIKIAIQKLQQFSNFENWSQL